MSLEWDERHLITRMSRWEKSEMKLRKRKKILAQVQLVAWVGIIRVFFELGRTGTNYIRYQLHQ